MEYRTMKLFLRVFAGLGITASAGMAQFPLTAARRIEYAPGIYG